MTCDALQCYLLPRDVAQDSDDTELQLERCRLTSGARSTRKQCSTVTNILYLFNQRL